MVVLLGCRCNIWIISLSPGLLKHHGRGARKNVIAGRWGSVMWNTVFCKTWLQHMWIHSCCGYLWRICMSSNQLKPLALRRRRGSWGLIFRQRQLAVGGGWWREKSLFFGVWLWQVAHASLDDPILPALIGLGVSLKTKQQNKQNEDMKLGGRCVTTAGAQPAFCCWAVLAKLGRLD